MAMYYYNPPELDEDGNPFPPFVFSSSGTERSVMAHRYWKREVIPYVVEELFDKFGKPIVDRKTGKQKCIMGRKSEWVLDEKLNAELDAGQRVKPNNVLHLTKTEWNDLQQNKHRKFLKHLVSGEDAQRKERQSLEELKKQQFEEIEREKRLIEEERNSLRAVREERDRLKAEIEAEIETLRAAGDSKRRGPGRPRKDELR